MPLIKIQRSSVLWQDNQLEYFPKFRGKKKTQNKLPTTITVAALEKKGKEQDFFLLVVKKLKFLTWQLAEI